MPDTNSSAAGATPATTKGKGLAELGYSRQGYLDKSYLDSLLVPVGQLPTSGGSSGEAPSSVQDKLIQYANERMNTRNQRVEGYINDYLQSAESNQNTVNLYRDLYDAYQLSNPESQLTDTGFIRELTNLDSKLGVKGTNKALDGLMGDWSSDPTKFLSSVKGSGLEWGENSPDAWVSSNDIGDVMGWDSGAYDRGFNSTGLEGFAARSRTVRAREEAARQAELQRLQEERDRLLAMQNRGGYNAINANEGVGGMSGMSGGRGGGGSTGSSSSANSVDSSSPGGRGAAGGMQA